MATLNLDDDNVFVAEISVEDARELLPTIDNDAVMDALDQAQGHVYMGNSTIANLVIRIKGE